MIDIGGKDLDIETDKGVVIASRIYHYWQQQYPTGVFEEDQESGGFFFYKTPEAKSAWDEDGWTKEHRSNMYQVIVDDAGLTITHEEGDEFEVEMKKLASG